jgi:hypothetical protein
MKTPKWYYFNGSLYKGADKGRDVKQTERSHPRKGKGVGQPAAMDPAKASGLTNIARETAAKVLCGALRYPSWSGGWQLGDLDLSEHLRRGIRLPQAASAHRAPGQVR